MRPSHARHSANRVSTEHATGPSSVVKPKLHFSTLRFNYNRTNREPFSQVCLQAAKYRQQTGGLASTTRQVRKSHHAASTHTDEETRYLESGGRTRFKCFLRSKSITEEVDQIANDFERMGQPFTENRAMDMILSGLEKRYELVRF